MSKEKIQRTVGVYDRPEKKAIPWTTIAITVAVVVAVVVVVLLT